MVGPPTFKGRRSSHNLLIQAQRPTVREKFPYGIEAEAREIAERDARKKAKAAGRSEEEVIAAGKTAAEKAKP